MIARAKARSPRERIRDLSKQAWQCVRQFCREEHIHLGDVTGTRIWIQSGFKPEKSLFVDWFLLQDAIRFCGDQENQDLNDLHSMTFSTWWLESLVLASERDNK